MNTGIGRTERQIDISRLEIVSIGSLRFASRTKKKRVALGDQGRETKREKKGTGNTNSRLNELVSRPFDTVVYVS